MTASYPLLTWICNHLLTSCLYEIESSNETAFSSVATVFDKCVSGAQIIQLVVTITGKKQASVWMKSGMAGYLTCSWKLLGFGCSDEQLPLPLTPT